MKEMLSRNCLLRYDSVWCGFHLRVRRVKEVSKVGAEGSSTTWVNYDAYHEHKLFVSPSQNQSLRCRVAEERIVQGTATTNAFAKLSFMLLHEFQLFYTEVRLCPML
jgi:hypothetical protein